MRLTVLDEPPLEFSGGARHVDPRHGITDYGPADATNTAARTIRAGIVGTRRRSRACAAGWTGAGDPSRRRTVVSVISSSRSPASTPAPGSAPR